MIITVSSIVGKPLRNLKSTFVTLTMMEPTPTPPHFLVFPVMTAPLPERSSAFRSSSLAYDGRRTLCMALELDGTEARGQRCILAGSGAGRALRTELRTELWFLAAPTHGTQQTTAVPFRLNQWLDRVDVAVVPI